MVPLSAAIPFLSEYQMSNPQPPLSRRLSVSALALSALLLSSLPLLAGCEGHPTDDPVLIDHSGLNPDSIYRHHHNG